MTCIAGLRRRVADAAGDDDRAVARRRCRSPALPRYCDEAADQPNGRRRAERGQVVLIDLVAQAGVADLVQADELVEAVACCRPA